MILRSSSVFFMLLLAPPWALAASSSHSNAANYEALSIARDSSAIAYIDSDEKNLIVKKGDGRAYHLAIPNFAEKVSLTWSPDGRYVLMEYQSNDDSSFVYSIDVEGKNGLNPRFLSEGFSARWFGSGHSVLIVPNYGAAEIQSKRGVICMAAGSSEKKSLFERYYFTGNYVSNKFHLLAQVFTMVNGREKYELFMGNLPSSGQCE